MAQLACKSRNVARRRAAEDVARALGVPPGQDVLTIRCLWTVGGEPAAYTASYLPPEMEGLVGEQADACSRSPHAAVQPSPCLPA